MAEFQAWGWVMLWTVLLFFGSVLLIGFSLWVSSRRSHTESDPALLRPGPMEGWATLTGAEYEEIERERIEEDFALDDYDRVFGDDRFDDSMRDQP